MFLNIINKYPFTLRGMNTLSNDITLILPCHMGPLLRKNFPDIISFINGFIRDEDQFTFKESKCHSIKLAFIVNMLINHALTHLSKVNKSFSGEATQLFIFASLLNGDQTLKGKNLLLWEQILVFKSRSHFEKVLLSRKKKSRQKVTKVVSSEKMMGVSSFIT